MGGAANACIRLHKALLEAGVESKLLLLKKTTDIPETFEVDGASKIINNSNSLINKAFRRLKRLFNIKTKLEQESLYRSIRLKGLEGVSFPQSDFDLTDTVYYKEADIINLHWVAGFIDWPTFFTKNTKPVVWTLHDKNPFLGANHYDENLYGIYENGFPKIRAIAKQETKWENKLLKIKEKALAKSIKPLIIVCPSVWLQKESEKSLLFKRFKHIAIPNGIDTTVFKLGDQQFARNTLHLPLDKKMILFVSDAVSNNRKGFEYLQNAMKSFSLKHNIFLCAIGKCDIEEKLRNVLYLGKIQDEKMMSLAYSAADLFVIPSVEDNFPNTVIESLCCGTPVAGFTIGGLPEIIQNGFNGFLSKEINVESLSCLIQQSLNFTFDRTAISKAAVMEYTASIQAKKYIEIYHSLNQTA